MEPNAVGETPVVIETGATPDASVIWLHGLGADGHDFEGIVPQLRLPSGMAVRFIFPHAPFRAVTINNGYVMRAWYDIAMSDNGLSQNMEHIRASAERVGRIVDQEVERGVRPERIVLGGFSQGGAVAMHAGLTHPRRLAGILFLSAPLPDGEALLSGIDREHAGLPVFMGHGTRDPLIPFNSALTACELLKAHGAGVEWRAYDMEHAVHPREIEDISRWLIKVLG